MLIIAITLILVCPTVLPKYDLRKYVNTFKARSQTSVNKHNPTCGMCCCGMRYILSYCNWYGQEDFTWQEIWKTSIFLFKVRWNEHLVSYFSPMYRYGINTNTLHLTFFSCRISFLLYKMLIITGISMETRNELTIYATLCRNVSVFYWQELASLFQVQEKFKTCRNSKWKFLSFCLQMTVMSKLSG